VDQQHSTTIHKSGAPGWHVALKRLRLTLSRPHAYKRDRFFVLHIYVYAVTRQLDCEREDERHKAAAKPQPNVKDAVSLCLGDLTQSTNMAVRRPVFRFRKSGRNRLLLEVSQILLILITK
jgi:hypothetical protein